MFKTVDKVCRLIWWVWNNWRIVTADKVSNFLRAKKRQVLDSKKSPVIEQYEWRYSQVQQKSPNCIKKGACVKCGCETPDKFYEPKACDSECYPEWMEPDEWEKFKELNKIG